MVAASVVMDKDVTALNEDYKKLIKSVRVLATVGISHTPNKREILENADKTLLKATGGVDEDLRVCLDAPGQQNAVNKALKAFNESHKNLQDTFKKVDKLTDEILLTAADVKGISTGEAIAKAESSGILTQLRDLLRGITGALCVAAVLAGLIYVVWKKSS